MLLRAFCLCLSLISLGGCAHMWEKEYIEEMNHPEKRRGCHGLKIKDSAFGSVRRKTFDERVETWQ